MNDRRSRILRNLLDPLAAVVFFSDEAHAAYEGLGFPPPQVSAGGTRAPNQAAYIMARAACLGEVPPTVVAAAFAVFEPQRIDHVVRRWRPRVRIDALQDGRCDVAVAALRRMIGPPTPEMARTAALLRGLTDALRPEGRPLFAGLRSLPFRGDPVFDLWHAADLFREHRGDSHISSWTSRGLSAVEACLINDLSQGLPLKSYVRTRGWGDAALDGAVDALALRGLLADGTLTAAGVELRDDIERATDLQQAHGVAAIDDQFEQLCSVLGEYRTSIAAARGYPDRSFVARVTEWH